jgi:hypothetical protein
MHPPCPFFKCNRSFVTKTFLSVSWFHCLSFCSQVFLVPFSCYSQGQHSSYDCNPKRRCRKVQIFAGKRQQAPFVQQSVIIPQLVAIWRLHSTLFRYFCFACLPFSRNFCPQRQLSVEPCSHSQAYENEQWHP